LLIIGLSLEVFNGKHAYVPCGIPPIFYSTVSVYVALRRILGTYVILLYFAWIGGCERKEPGYLRQSTRGDGYNQRGAQYRYRTYY
jgi:hypothetical protein